MSAGWPSQQLGMHSHESRIESVETVQHFLLFTAAHIPETALRDCDNSVLPKSSLFLRVAQPRTRTVIHMLIHSVMLAMGVCHLQHAQQQGG